MNTEEDVRCSHCKQTKEEAAAEWKALYGDEVCGIFYKACPECGMKMPDSVRFGIATSDSPRNSNTSDSSQKTKNAR